MTRLALVTGAHGFIGRHVCRTLSARGFEVRALGHGVWLPEEAAQWGISRWHEADIAIDGLCLLAANTRVEFIIHCGGSGAVANSYSSPRGDFQRSVQSTADVLEFARMHSGGAPRVVIASSAAVYGDQGDVDLVEASARLPISPYGFHKLLAEQLCESYARFFAVPVSVVRLFSVYGKGLRKQLLWDACQKLANNTPRFFGTGDELRDWIHVEDAAAILAAAACAAQGPFQVYNGGGDKAATRLVLTTLAHFLDSGIAPVFTGETHLGNPRRLTSESSHAWQQLGWKAIVPLRSGLAEYADWFKRHSSTNRLSA